MQALRRIFGDGYRVFFLAAGVYAVLTLALWLHWLTGGTLPVGDAPVQWHAHEMIFGYGGAALGGFLLTAVPNWTGVKAAPHLFIGTAAALWLIGRLAVWYAAGLPPALVALADLAFLPILGAKILTQLLRRPKPQNMVFLAFLTLIWTGNLLVHLEWAGAAGTAALGLRVGLLGLCAMIAVLGGRVTPAFTRNAMKRAGLPEARWPVSRRAIELPAAALVAAVPLALLAALPRLAGVLALAGGALQFLRLARWGTGYALRQPILWSLHLGMAMLGAGLVLWGLAAFGIGSEVGALHVLGIGAVGGMTLAVMSRAILGHSGRDLVAPPAVALGYGLIGLAALVRWAGAVAGGWYTAGLLISGGLWIAAFALFVVALWPAIAGPRAGREPA